MSSGGRPHDFTRRAAGSARLPSSATGETTIRPQQEASRMNRTLCAVGFAAQLTPTGNRGRSSSLCDRRYATRPSRGHAMERDVSDAVVRVPFNGCRGWRRSSRRSVTKPLSGWVAVLGSLHSRYPLTPSRYGATGGVVDALRRRSGRIPLLWVFPRDRPRARTRHRPVGSPGAGVPESRRLHAA